MILRPAVAEGTSFPLSVFEFSNLGAKTPDSFLVTKVDELVR